MGGRKTDADVLVVGYGPVGQTLSLLLARRGHRVVVVERWPSAYPMPRAVAFDSESARILASAGVGDRIRDFAEPSGEYRWVNAEGRTLLSIEAEVNGRCGWPDSSSMYQPALEEALAAEGAKLANLTVLRGRTAVELTDLGDRVELVVQDAAGAERTLIAGWVVGCDGANSFVRGYLGTGMTDLGFSHDWLICDVVPHERRTWEPNNLQVCDPARPRTHVSAGPGHRRWEFMRVAGETLDELNTPESVWRLLALFDITPENATLERHSVYTFNARWADSWRRGRALIAGDAAHVMPPFAAQGMCSGFRDAANLAWKLDLVLRGLATQPLLDSYTVERRQHVEHAVRMSVNLGRVICQDDPVAARDRDVAMIAARERGVGVAQPKAAVQPLRSGVLYAKRGLAGDLVPQGRVTRGGRTALFDEVVGTGFVLLTTAEPERLLSSDDAAFLASLDTHVVHVVADGAIGDQVADTEGGYLPYLGGACAALVRPDFYVYGAAEDRAGLADMIGALRADLAGAVPS